MPSRDPNSLARNDRSISPTAAQAYQQFTSKPEYQSIAVDSSAQDAAAAYGVSNSNQQRESMLRKQEQAFIDEERQYAQHNSDDEVEFAPMNIGGGLVAPNEDAGPIRQTFAQGRAQGSATPEPQLYQ